MRGVRLISWAAVALLLGCPMANAQGHLNVFVGSNFAGEAGRSLSAALIDGSRLTWGADLGAVSNGIFGTELDIAFASQFFGNGPANQFVGNGPQTGNNYVLTVMPSVTIGVPVGGERGPRVQPYATAGLGLIRRSIDIAGEGTFRDNSLGYSLGFGVNGYATSHFGVRVDYRYIRNMGAELSDNPFGIDFNRRTFGFSRGTVGAVFRF
jgi:opacity protein-like surface antigen